MQLRGVIAHRVWRRWLRLVGTACSSRRDHGGDDPDIAGASLSGDAAAAAADIPRPGSARWVGNYEVAGVGLGGQPEYEGHGLDGYCPGGSGAAAPA